MISAFAALGIFMIVIPFVANIGGATGFYICTVLLIFFGLATGVVVGTGFATAALFPSEYIAAVIFGNGLSATGTCILRALTLVIFPSGKNENNEFYGALALNFFAAIVMALCSLATACLKKNEFAMFYLRKLEAKSVVS